MKSLSKEAFSKLRDEMVEDAIFARGVRSEAVLSAMRSVPREAFLPKQLREFAYEDSPLPIDEGQTISQPYIVAFMTEALALEGGERVLEIGTGSGYAAAVLAEIAGGRLHGRTHRPARGEGSVAAGRSRLPQRARPAWRRNQGLAASMRPMTASSSPRAGPEFPNR